MNKTPAPGLSHQPGGAVSADARGTTARQPVDMLIERLQRDLLAQGIDPAFVRREMLALSLDTRARLAAAPGTMKR